MLKERKSVSTVVGGFFFLVLMVGAFTAILTAIQFQSDLVTLQRAISDQETLKTQEKFSIAAFINGSNNNKLSVQVQNRGSIPIEISDLFIVNKSISSYPVTPIEIDPRDAPVPISSTEQILANQPIFMKNGKYDLKVVSSLGTAQTLYNQTAPSANPLTATLYAVPPSIESNGTVSIVMHVTNRHGVTLFDVKPTANPTVTPSDTNILTLPVIPQRIDKLDPNEDILFLWNYTIKGAGNTPVRFNTTATARDFDGVRFTSNQTNSSLRILPEIKFSAKPQIFVAAPSPFGESTGDIGYFNVNIVNPTNTTMTVNQVSVEAISPDASDIFGTVTGIFPTTGWNPGHSVAYWEDTTGVTIPRHNVRNFTVQIASLASTSSQPINALAFNAITNLGQFSKTGYSLGTDKDNTAIVQVYQSSTSAGSDQRYAIRGILKGTTHNYNVTIHNTGDREILASPIPRLLIYIPPGFKNLNNVTEPTGMDAERFVTLDDGTVQIPVKLTTALLTNTKRTYVFTATAPDITDTTMYLFNILATGTAEDAAANEVVIIGPFAETIVQVCPTSACN